MTTLEAQGIAATKVRALRGLTADLEQLLQRICDNDRDLRAVMPLLSPAAKAEVNTALEEISTKAAETLLRFVNPAEDPA